MLALALALCLTQADAGIASADAGAEAPFKPLVLTPRESLFTLLDGGIEAHVGGCWLDGRTCMAYERLRVTDRERAEAAEAAQIKGTPGQLWPTFLAGFGVGTAVGVVVTAVVMTFAKPAPPMP